MVMSFALFPSTFPGTRFSALAEQPLGVECEGRWALLKGAGYEKIASLGSEPKRGWCDD